MTRTPSTKGSPTAFCAHSRPTEAPRRSTTRGTCAWLCRRRKEGFGMSRIALALLVGFVSGGAIAGTYVNRVNTQIKLAHRKATTELMAAKTLLAAAGCVSGGPASHPRGSEKSGF
jgi:hypothetical protein